MRACLQRIGVLLGVCALAITAAVPPAIAAGGCGGPADSALNQYCESIPTSRGAHQVQSITPGSQGGSPAIATSLPPAIVRQIERAASRDARAGHVQRAARERALLTLSAPDHPRSIRHAAVTESSAIPLWLTLLLVAAGLGLATAAGARWRRRHRPEG